MHQFCWEWKNTYWESCQYSSQCCSSSHQSQGPASKIYCNLHTLTVTNITEEHRYTDIQAYDLLSEGGSRGWSNFTIKKKCVHWLTSVVCLWMNETKYAGKNSAPTMKQYCCYKYSSKSLISLVKYNHEKLTLMYCQSCLILCEMAMQTKILPIT